MKHKIIQALAVISACASPCWADEPPLQPTTDFSQAEAREAHQGGDATQFKKITRNSFSHPSANMRAERKIDFVVGNGFFKRIWVSAPSSTKAADGLGPLYNAKTCKRCHVNDGRGHPPTANWPDDDAVSMFLRLSIPPQTEDQRRQLAAQRISVVAEPTYGDQLQDFAIQGLAPEGRMHIAYEELTVDFADGQSARLRKPTYTITDLSDGPLHPDTMMSPRIAPPMIGLGLLEQIPAAAILANADPDDADGDGVSGTAQKVWDPDTNAPALGRFGWKAGNATVDAQVQAAFTNDIGISTPLAPYASGNCTASQILCQNAPHGGDAQYDGLEAPQQVTDLVLFYARHLAVPARRDVDDKTVRRGKRLFYETGCIACHTPKFKTAPDGPEPELAGQLIWPYTDLLLHDMGEGLADGRPEGLAGGRDWKTPPLWGIGLTRQVGGHTFFLHDGRARNLTEAILWHGGEAATARDRFRALSADNRAALLRFLNSL